MFLVDFTGDDNVSEHSCRFLPLAVIVKGTHVCVRERANIASIGMASTEVAAQDRCFVDWLHARALTTQ